MTTRKPDPAELFRLFAVDEPEEVRKGYLFAPDQGRLLSTGFAVPLLVPEFRLNGSELALPIRAAGPQPIDFMKTFVTLEEYALAEPGSVKLDMSAVVEATSTVGTFRQRISDAAVLNHMSARADEMATLADGYAQLLKPPVAERLRNALRPGPEGQERLLLSRQALLASMRQIILRHEAETEPVANSMIHAIMLSHAIGSELYSRREDAPALGGMPSDLVMEIIQNELFYRSDLPLSMMYRTYAMWTEYGGSLKRTAPRLDPIGLLREATGLDLVDWLGLGFAIWAHRNSWKLPGPMWMPRSYLGNVVDEKALSRFLDLVSSDASEFAASFDEDRGAWNYLPFQQRPVLRMDDDFLLLDEGLLLERITSGLYWDVHDHEKRRHGEKARRLWTQAYAEMLERYAIDILGDLAPPLLEGGRSIYSEEQFRDAYQGKICDAGVDFGADFCAVEIVSGQVRVGTRIGGETSDFEADTERLVLKKARQLHEAALSFVQNEEALTGRTRPEGRRMFPVIVNIGTYPVNPMSISYVEERLSSEGLLADSRMQPLSIIDISELEMLHGWSVSGGPIMPDVLRKWKGSNLARVSLRNFAFALVPESGKYDWRSPRAVAGSKAIFDSVIERMRLREKSE